MIVDSAKIFVRSGKGGDGAVTFRRLKYIPKGGPDGGDGGDGGSVILLADPEVETLLDFAGRHHWLAQDGEAGRSKQQHGKDGKDLLVRLPAGTLVYDDESGNLLVDLDAEGKQFIIARGGRGGFGNEHFKTATNQTPRQSTPGEPGEELTLRLELKLLADVGLVGKPNAGKSTLLARISQATPKIADYPFTTLVPQLGIANLRGDRRLVVADLPGLIENAHQGQGLGTRFLRHIERTRVLVHVIDADPTDGSDPIDNYRAIRHELTQYTGDLPGKPEIVALSKMDTLASDDDRAAAASLIGEALGKRVVPISSVSGRGLDDLLEACWQALGAHESRAGGWSVQSSDAES